MNRSALNQQLHQTLVDFLRVESELAFTFLQTAEIESSRDPAHSKSAFQKAGDGLKTLRRFLVGIEDPAERAEIGSNADKLEVAIGEGLKKLKASAVNPGSG